MFNLDSDSTKQLMNTFAGLQKPLRPFASHDWYCCQTNCLGNYCEAGVTELYGQFAEKVQKFDEAFEEANRRCQKFRDQRVIKDVKTDSYGFLGYGDGVHWVWTPNVDVPENIAWDGNYKYIKESVDRMIAVNKKGGVDAQAYSFMYFKTGEKKYLDAALANLPQDGQLGNPCKNYALAMRNADMCIFDLYKAAQKDNTE